MKHTLLLGTVLCIPAAAIGTTAWAQGMPPGGMAGMSAPATEVGYVVMEPQSVPLTTTLPGRVVAYSTAEVRPQVGGIITSVSVKEGQTVAAGDVLFTVDDENYRAELEAAQASVSSAEAQVPSAQDKVTRYESLIDTGGVSQAELGTARVELAQAKASVASARAQLRSAEITLARTSIRAPIAGVVGSVNTEIGSLVTAGQADAMTTIRKTDPIYVTLVESSSNILSNRPAGATTREVPPPSPTVTLTLDDGSVYDQTGTISSADLVVSESTGTVTLRATIPNPDFLLLPGMFVRAHLDIGQQDGVFLVPQRAVTFSSNGEPAAFFVTEENKVQKRVFTATQDMNNAWVVTAGVSAGDKLVVDGLQKISDGAAVSPIEVTISEDGVVYQDMSTSAMPAGGPPAGGVPTAAPTDGTSPEGMPASTDGAAPATETAK